MKDNAGNQPEQTCADGEFPGVEFIRRHRVGDCQRHLAADFAGGKLHQQQNVLSADVLVCQSTRHGTLHTPPPRHHLHEGHVTSPLG